MTLSNLQNTAIDTDQWSASTHAFHT